MHLKSLHIWLIFLSIVFAHYEVDTLWPSGNWYWTITRDKSFDQRLVVKRLQFCSTTWSIIFDGLWNLCVFPHYAPKNRHQYRWPLKYVYTWETAIFFALYDLWFPFPVDLSLRSTSQKRGAEWYWRRSWLQVPLGRASRKSPICGSWNVEQWIKIPPKFEPVRLKGFRYVNKPWKQHMIQ